jgi:hypothetical protein
MKESHDMIAITAPEHCHDPLASDTRSPIFIGGQRRSGTSLFRVLLNRHPHIACGPESKFVQDPALAAWHDRLSDEWRGRVERWGFGQAAIDRAMAALIDNIFTRYQLAQGKLRWAEKTPANIQRIDYLFRLFPHAQFLHVVRDPRDTYCSIRERSRRDKPEWAKFSPKRTARDWCHAIHAGKRWSSDAERYMQIRYEDLAREPEATLRDVLAFLGEPWDARMLDPEADNDEAHNDPQVQHGPVHSSSVGRWRSLLSECELREIQRLAGDLMVEIGYGLAPTARD